ncbi:MAG: cytidylate kinase [Alphaproteobacteria bacterium]|nr:cytidylate kinase [Alphaproteobacteria bacterium]
MTPVVAIDGPAGSGKGTMARKLASHFGFVYLDTGMMYRAVAYLNLSADKLSWLSIADFMAAVRKIPDANLRTDEVSLKTSTISKQPEIRESMVRLQREFAKNPGKKYKGAILDGRDIGTVVVPDAVCKLFITADVKVRAERRFVAIKQTNKQATFDEVYENLKKRDEQDSSRNIAPMKFDESYVLVDTSKETAKESFAKVVKIVENAFAAANMKI